jgi:hypothetical protein
MLLSGGVLVNKFMAYAYVALLPTNGPQLQKYTQQQRRVNNDEKRLCAASEDTNWGLVASNETRKLPKVRTH